MGARYYLPETARFITPDPLGHSASADLYSFANGDPVNFVDPTGRARQSGIDAIGKDPGYDFISYSVGLAQGFAVDGAWGTAKGLWSLASSPLDSARSFGSAVYNYRDTYQALKFGIGDYLNKVQSGDPRAIGLGSFELLTALVPVSKAKYLSKVDNFAPSAKGVGSSFSGATNNVDDYLRLADNLDVSTARNSAVFYSGRGNRELAEAFATQNGRTTLEMTPGGRWLDQQGFFEAGSPLTRSEAAQVWSRLSERFANEASGNAVGFVNGARANGIFNAVEYPALRANPNITNVITGGN